MFRIVDFFQGLRLERTALNSFEFFGIKLCHYLHTKKTIYSFLTFAKFNENSIVVYTL